ncbi:TetR/AcrR family transcriptional regulator [Phenylobacterium sp. VNQ135]|uniref:TetR/AcrR family transcriptional regulator n=1 Tax=Phenylobacterium sp. VNQ135 TaxID=3400922 RepID=UPI003C0E27C1
MARTQAKKPTPKPRSRRTNAERSATTRAKLIETTIACLHELGYSATTTLEIAARAEVTRGAILHHFPTKVDLILAVASHIADAQFRDRRRALMAVPRGYERFMALTEVTWRSSIEPPAIALLEIMVGSRSDPALAEELPRLMAQIERRHQEGVWEIAVDAGITDHETIHAMVTLHIAAMQGLSIRLMHSNDRSQLEPPIELLKMYRAFLTQHLIDKARSDSS